MRKEEKRRIIMSKSKGEKIGEGGDEEQEEEDTQNKDSVKAGSLA